MRHPQRRLVIVVRADPVGDYRVPDGRHLAGLTGRLVELLSEPVPTTCLAMYLVPHANVVVDGVRAARAAGFAPQVRTIAKAVGSDVTNVVQNCLREGRFGAATFLMATFLAHDDVTAVSEYTRDEIVLAAEAVDLHCGTRFARACRDRVTVSYPPIDTAAYLDLDDDAIAAGLHRRGLERDGYVLFLSRVTRAKGVLDLIDAYAASRARDRVKLVIAGTGTGLAEARARAADDPRVVFLTDVDDDEKPLLMRGCATYALPTKPEPDFVETFGIALTEKMLAGGGPVITTLVGGTGEAVGDTAVIVEAGNVAALRDALDAVVLEMSDAERRDREHRGRAHALAFDRVRVFDDLFRVGMPATVTIPPVRMPEERRAETV